MQVDTLPEPAVRRAAAAPSSSRERRGRAWPLAVAGLLLIALGLRLWGITWGLPFTYNLDERAHFVPKAVGFFSGDLDPHYQLNPPGFSYLIGLAYAVWFHGGDAVRSAYADDPSKAFLVARTVSALMGTASVGLLYLAGARLFGRWTGLLAGALLAVAYMPVFYAHQAINDAPTLAGVSLSLVGAALVLRRGRLLDYALAGLGAGLAAGLKYNAGIILLALVGAAIVHFADGERRKAIGGLILGGVASVVGFLLLDPYAVLDLSTFHDAMQFLVDYNARERLIGEQETSGLQYYAWTLTWGLGWVPLALASAGGVGLAVRDRRAALVLVPTAVLFFFYMGSQGRYFGRYMLPIFPLLCLLAAYGGVQAVRLVGGRRPRLMVPFAALIAAAGVGQGLVTSLHSDMVLAREDTRTAARKWMVSAIPPRTTIVVEPAVPRGWYRDGGKPEVDVSAERWSRWRRTGALSRRLRKVHPGAAKKADFQNYVITLFPGMLDVYRSERACWYVSSSSQRGRAFADQQRVPEAVAFYKALDRESRVVYRASPFRAGEAPLPFQFDFSFNYYPLAYEKPGPVMTVHRLDDCRE